jgi:hypothetical protein
MARRALKLPHQFTESFERKSPEGALATEPLLGAAAAVAGGAAAAVAAAATAALAGCGDKLASRGAAIT